jgi:hypothetical protein
MLLQKMGVLLQHKTSLPRPFAWHEQVHCESPLNLKVADNANHTLEVVLADVCGEAVANGIFFGSWGWLPNLKFKIPELPAALEPAFNDSSMDMQSRSPIRRERNSGAPGAAASVLLAAAAGALGVIAAVL